MKALVLKKRGVFELLETPIPEPEANEVSITVACCSVCRTDAKMWQSGHRDLVLPRIPGHEISGYVAGDPARPVSIWPGTACGTCRYCKGGRENLCPSMKILGFHRNGGFAEHVTVPRTSLFAVPQELPMPLAALAEPLACALHGLDQAAVDTGDRVLIYGAGTLGIFLALGAQARGASALIVDPCREKLEKSRVFCAHIGVPGIEDPREASGEFDAVINAASAPATLDGLLKIRSGGRFCLFSNLATLPESGSQLLAVLHYRELQLVGAYGCTRKAIESALDLLAVNRGELGFLIERIMSLEDVPAVMADVLGGEQFKYIIDFQNQT
ncbi:MAG: alcohol dehydrogenase catalytic domain-containing protein [Chlorobiaceae bacterium]|jgi:L-iditol 2-dehydrogenase|nr:alcohol dehydrogenase catalytic domain-containing protein [Chlorobiaceae bacterium]